jgi:uncharacterized repeat protein (TIGR03803 family)
MTYAGGVNDLGVLFQYDPATNTYTKKLDFNGTANGSNANGSLMQASDGKLYGMTENGGVNSKGVLFQYDPATSTYAKKFDFDGTVNGSSPRSSLMEASDGKLYGMTSSGGTYSVGVLFQYNPATSSYTKKLDFDGTTNGGYAIGNLMQASDGKLYGMTNQGGANGGGVLFQYDPATSTYAKKLDFNGTANGRFPSGSLMQGSDGKLYGMTSQGGTYIVGVLFQYDPATSIFTKKLDFKGGAVVYGTNPNGSLMRATDGKLYGMTYQGGANYKGVLFQYDPATSIYTKKFDFDGTTNGSYPQGSLMQASDGKLYGMTSSGGTYSVGVLFQYDPATSTYTKKIDFNGGTVAYGTKPYGSLIQASDGKLYGITYQGGVNNKGVLFQYDLATSIYTKKFDFDGTVNGSYPYGSLMQASDGKMYGLTSSGGAHNDGVLFQYDPTTSTCTKKMDFDNTANITGAGPTGSLIQATDGKLYGMTTGGGANSFGVLFQYDLSTSTYTRKLDFNGAANGSYPLGSLMQATDGKLYGMTSDGGANSGTNGGGYGVLFQYDPVTSITQKKLDFNVINGIKPQYTNLIEVSSGVSIGIQEQQINNSFLIYPNPNSGNFIIETEAETLTTITNMLGETILTLQLQKGKNEINLNKQSNGVYFIKTGNSNFKLIKH